MLPGNIREVGMDRLRNQRKEARFFWQEHIQNCSASEYSINEYCRCHGLKPSAFYYWKRKLRAADGTGRNLVEIKLPSSSPSPIEVILRNQIRLRVAYSFDADRVQSLARAMESL